MFPHAFEDQMLSSFNIHFYEVKGIEALSLQKCTNRCGFGSQLCTGGPEFRQNRTFTTRRCRDKQRNSATSVTYGQVQRLDSRTELIQFNIPH